jgi:hypothetical protein
MDQLREAHLAARPLHFPEGSRLRCRRGDLAQPARREVELGLPGLLRRPQRRSQPAGPGPTPRRAVPASPAGTYPGLPVTNPTAGAVHPNSAHAHKWQQRRHHGGVPAADDDLFAALRRLRAAFGPIQVVQVVSNQPGEDLAAQANQPTKVTRMVDPRRMTPEEHGQAHALLVKAVSDPDWQAASEALDALLQKLLVLQRLLEAEERLAKRGPPAAGESPSEAEGQAGA